MNTDVFLGPNFVDPKETFADGMTDNEKFLQKQARDFHINPSAPLINKASKTVYENKVPFYPEMREQMEITVVKNGVDQDPYIFHSVQRHDRPRTITVNSSTITYDPQKLTDKQLQGIEELSDLTDAASYPYKRDTVATKRIDGTTITKTPSSTGKHTHLENELAFEARWNGAGIERGAYECAAALQRVLYVRAAANGKRDGTTWEDAFNELELQKAIDVASVYSTINEPRERAYIFVKSSDSPYGEIKVRDGVSVYGGIAAAGFTDMAGKTEGQYTDSDINSYINLVCAKREPIASKDARMTTITKISSDPGNNPELGFMIDGFQISNGSTNLTTSPIVMDKDYTVLKNMLITDNTVATAGVPVVDLSTSTSLLYNSLIYGNTAGSGAAVVNVGTDKGYMLNCTVVAPDNTAASGTASHIGNSILRDNTNTGPMFAPYLNSNIYTLPTDFTDHVPYHYQLHEESKEIDGGKIQTAAGDGITALSTWLPSDLQPFVNFTDRAAGGGEVGLAGDLDVLGNPRQLGGLVDNGCFETWSVSGVKYATSVTTGTHATNYGGHQYPHHGSVVYINNNASLVLNAGEFDGTEGKPAISPGYVLVKDGGSLYGQGNLVNLAYVAAERDYTTQQYALTALPYPYNINNVLSTSYTSGTDALTQTSEAVTGWTYDADTEDGRAKWRYAFKEENSSLWKPHGNTVNANEGWLLDLGESTTKTLRYTSWGTDPSDYIYTENGTPKTVTLTQYNATPDNGSAEFTALEDMGWNLVGQPWLVSAFRTYPLADGTYAMNIPHVFYSMSGDDYSHAPGQVYTSRSWDDGATFNLGNANFMQTATLDATETLTFKVPMYSGADPTAPSPHYVGICCEDNEDALPVVDDVVSIWPEQEADKAMPYKLGSDGVKLGTPDRNIPQLFVSNAAGTRLSLVSKAPEEVDISLGYVAPKEGQYTILLPETEVYEKYEGVWLTDHATGTVTNLLTDDYKLNVTETGENVVRLTIRFGAKRNGTDENNNGGGNGDIHESDAGNSDLPIIYVEGLNLHADNLKEGDVVAVYTTSGVLIDRRKVTESTYVRRVEPGIYIVKVNNIAKSLRTDLRR